MAVLLHSTHEMLAMVMITGLTNLWGVPGVILAFKHGWYFNAFIGFFTVLTSFMYHFLQSIQVNEFLFDEGHWHRLDNIGAIVSLITVIVVLMNNQSQLTDEKLNFLGLFITIILQEGFPWDLTFTLLPISLFLIILIYQTLRKANPPLKNKQAIKYGNWQIVLAAACFILGLGKLLSSPPQTCTYTTA